MPCRLSAASTASRSLAQSAGALTSAATDSIDRAKRSQTASSNGCVREKRVTASHSRCRQAALSPTEVLVPSSANGRGSSPPRARL